MYSQLAKFGSLSAVCISVEQAHFDQLARHAREKILELRRSATERGQEFLLSLQPGYAEAAIVFRDFPKVHGNIIQKAVGLALSGHVGGRSETEKRFKFLSGISVSVDNFFLARTGKIYLFETKRDIRNVRVDMREVAARNLKDVAAGIELFVATKTGRKLRYPIELAFFSYVHPKSPFANQIRLNVGSSAAPLYVTMPVYGRIEMNDLIGDCFGIFLDSFDDFRGQEIGQNIQGVQLPEEKPVGANPLHMGSSEAEDGGVVLIGTGDCEAPSENDILM
jgi:hypothetical protein